VVLRTTVALILSDEKTVSSALAFKAEQDFLSIPDIVFGLAGALQGPNGSLLELLHSLLW
jgi:hypothetical protein